MIEKNESEILIEGGESNGTSKYSDVEADRRC